MLQLVLRLHELIHGWSCTQNSILKRLAITKICCVRCTIEAASFVLIRPLLVISDSLQRSNKCAAVAE